MKDRKQMGIEAAKAVAGLVNIIGPRDGEDAFIKELTLGTHRTLQQSAGWLMFRTIAEFAKQYDEGRYDARNEVLGRYCKQLVDSNPDLFDNRFPVI